MSVVGAAIELTVKSRPTARVVVLDDADGVPSVVDQFEITSDDTDLATQLHDLADTMRSRLTALRPEAVFVRRADRPARANNNEGPRLRLLAEGALISAARAVVVNTQVGAGKDAGKICGTSKDEVDQEARLLAKNSGLVGKWKESVGAALTALRLR